MLYQQITSNKHKTLVVIVLYTWRSSLQWVSGGYYAIGMRLLGCRWLYSMMMIANATNVMMQLNHAESTDKNQAPMIWDIVSDMAIIAKVPMPHVFIIEDESQTRLRQEVLRKAAVAVTTRLAELFGS